MQTEFMKQRMQHILDGRPLAKKQPKPIPQISEKRKAKLKEDAKSETGLKATKKALNTWFAEITVKHWPEGKPCKCMECGKEIPASFARAAIAHLLPKKTFKSVDTHEENYMILGAGCGCHYLTDRVDKIVKLKVWPEIARRMKILITELPHEELSKISTELHEALDNTD